MVDPRVIRQEIFRLIMEGKSIRAIGALEGLPCASTIMNWIAADPEFRAGYAAAKALYAETLADEIIEISDDAARDWVDSDTGGRELDHEHVQRSRLRVDSRKWLAARLSPKRYGDSSMLKIGELDNAPRKELTPTEIAARLAALAAAQNKE
ncbi:terminase small subunit-like protein [Sphingobium indicum]